jgi:hypothetical protein
LVLWLNQKTYTPHLLVHGADRTQHHLTSRSSGHRVPDLCLIIPDPLHQVSYSWLDPHRYLPYRTCQLHTTRQANMILHMNKNKSIKPPKSPRFEFKPWQVNDSSQSNQGNNHLISQILLEVKKGPICEWNQQLIFYHWLYLT